MAVPRAVAATTAARDDLAIQHLAAPPLDLFISIHRNPPETGFTARPGGGW
ncbi:hypothetical protein ACWD4G_34400 [Streptomyces sp. NPDC002643]